MTQACIDGISDTVAGMRTQTDPFSSQTESLATSGAGELERLRWTLSRALGWPYWYSLDQNINFAHAGATGYIQGSGFARHVTAVGYHAWAGSARFPVYSTVNFHLTGLWFPRAGTQPRWTVAHHLAVSVGSGIDRDQTGIEVARFHLEALQFHHTVALRFAHSNAGLAAWQYPHVTALQVRRPQPGPDGALPNMADISDQIIVGHRGVALQLQGASLIPAANQLLGYGASGEFVEAKRISGTSNITITHQAGQLIFDSSGGALPVFQLTPLNAIFGTEKFPALARHNLANSTAYGLMFDDAQQQYAHFYAAIPSGITFTRGTMDLYSRQGTRTSGTVGWHVGVLTRADAEAFDAAHAATSTIYPATVKGTAGQVLLQTDDISVSGWAAGEVLRITIGRMTNGTDTTAATEDTTFIGAVIRLR